MKKHILIAGSILVGVGIMNVIPVKNNEGEILKDDVNIIQNNKNTYNEILQTDKNKQSNKENINDFSNVIEEIVNKQIDNIKKQGVKIIHG